MSGVLDLSGKHFGRLRVIAQAPKRPGSNVIRWYCQCSCGAPVKEIRGYLLTTGATKSCGCLANEETSKRNTVHGFCGTPEYAAWQGMWSRCTNPTDPAYPVYQHRSPPEEWKDFLVFYTELGRRPSHLHSLDRKDNTKPYGPGNCRWATDEEQSRNRITNINVLLNGAVMTLREACVICGFKYTTIYARYKTYGWDMRSASNGLFDLSKQGDLCTH